MDGRKERESQSNGGRMKEKGELFRQGKDSRCRWHLSKLLKDQVYTYASLSKGCLRA